MAEQELKKISQEELDEILAQHKLWVESNYKEGKRADLSYCDLRGLKFPEQVNLAGAFLGEANLAGAYLARTYLGEANLVGANLEGANLEGAYLVGAYLIGANLEGANLEGAYLIGAYLIGANLEGAYIIGANLIGANLEGAYLIGAYLIGANLEGANLEGANIEGAYLKYTILENKQSKNLEQEIIQHKLKVSQLENELKQAKLENNQSQEQQEKIAELEEKLEFAKQQEDGLQKIKKEKEELEHKLKVANNIKEANDALTTALKNTDKQIEINQKFAKNLQGKAINLISLDIVFIVAMPFCALFVTPFHDFLKEIGIGGILFLTFPILLILLIVLSLLRHQKQLIAEIRHYSMLKHKIELYGGILKAAQHMANSVIELKNTDNAKSAEYIQKVFDEIKAELLKSPNFDLNNQPHIFPEEGSNILEVIKSTITESIQKAFSSNK